MPSSGAYTVSIIVDGFALEEYELEQKGNVYSCWIASETGKNFSVQWSGAAQEASLKWSVYMDGTHMQAKAYMSGPQPINSNIKGRYISADSIRLFSFSKVLLTDDDSIASPDQNLSNLGTIEARIYRADVLRVRDIDPNPILTDSSGFDDKMIHERSKKLAMHHVSLKEAESVGIQPFYTTRQLENEPHARFVFKYRPRDFLISQGIIPGPEGEPTEEETRSKSNSPDPKGKKRKRASTTDVEDEASKNARRQLELKEKQMRELQAEIEQLRKDSGCVKQEVKTELLAFPVDEDGVIDLTD